MDFVQTIIENDLEAGQPAVSGSGEVKWESWDDDAVDSFPGFGIVGSGEDRGTWPSLCKVYAGTCRGAYPSGSDLVLLFPGRSASRQGLGRSKFDLFAIENPRSLSSNMFKGTGPH